jgi:hypothetical protein
LRYSHSRDSSDCVSTDEIRGLMQHYKLIATEWAEQFEIERGDLVCGQPPTQCRTCLNFEA